MGEGHGTHSFQSGMLGHGVLLLAVLTAAVLWGSALCCPLSAAASAQIPDPKLLWAELDKASGCEAGARKSFAAPVTSSCWGMWRVAAGPTVLQFTGWRHFSTQGLLPKAPHVWRWQDQGLSVDCALSSACCCCQSSPRA